MDDEIKGPGNSVNYTFRMHDPRVGRFFAIDPLTNLYPHYTPYSFSGNKVISYKELEGLEESAAYLSDEHIYQGLGEGIDGPDAIKPGKNHPVRQKAQDVMRWLIDTSHKTLQLLAVPGQYVGEKVEQALLNVRNEDGSQGFYSNLPTTDEAIRNGDEGMFYNSLINEQRALFASTAGSYTTFIFDAAVVDGVISVGGSSLTRFNELPLEKVKIRKDGLQQVKTHLEKFDNNAPGGFWKHNKHMVDRLQSIIDGTIDATKTDKLFYTHEITESILMKKYLDEGLSFDKAYQKAHKEAAELWNANPNGEEFYTKEANELFEKQLIDEADGKYDKP